jgi:Rad3-related DNA helicase
MNKVLQAGGRVIRTEEDAGVIALLDERFAYQEYKSLFPREWSNCRRVRLDTVESVTEDFWTGLT